MKGRLGPEAALRQAFKLKVAHTTVFKDMSRQPLASLKASM